MAGVELQYYHGRNYPISPNELAIERSAHHLGECIVYFKFKQGNIEFFIGEVMYVGKYFVTVTNMNVPCIKKTITYVDFILEQQHYYKVAKEQAHELLRDWKSCKDFNDKLSVLKKVIVNEDNCYFQQQIS